MAFKSNEDMVRLFMLLLEADSVLSKPQLASTRTEGAKQQPHEREYVSRTSRTSLAIVDITLISGDEQSRVAPPYIARLILIINQIQRLM